MLKVSEVFRSFQGEGSMIGYPFVFVRLAGCNLKCSFCDTKYAQDVASGVEWAEKDLAREIALLLSKPNGYVALSGGEPLLQLDNMATSLGILKEMRPVGSNLKGILIETNGHILSDLREGGSRELATSALRRLDALLRNEDCGFVHIVVSPKVTAWPETMVSSTLASIFHWLEWAKLEASVELKCLISPEEGSPYSIENWKKIFSEIEERELKRPSSELVMWDTPQELVFQPLLDAALPYDVRTRWLYDTLFRAGKIAEFPEFVRKRVRIIPQVQQLLRYPRGV